MLVKIKNTVFAGIFFSCIVSILWLLLSSGGSKIAISMICVAIIIFLIHYIVYRFSAKCSKTVKIICRAIGIIIAIILFLAASISVVAEMMLFNPYFDEKSYETLGT